MGELLAALDVASAIVAEDTSGFLLGSCRVFGTGKSRGWVIWPEVPMGPILLLPASNPHSSRLHVVATCPGGSVRRGSSLGR